MSFTSRGVKGMRHMARQVLIAVLLFQTAAYAQLNEAVLNTIKPRDIGPSIMGGRVVDFAIYEANPSIFYAATASGGLLKTINNGNTWENVFDRQATVSIGDVGM